MAEGPDSKPDHSRDEESSPQGSEPRGGNLPAPVVGDPPEDQPGSGLLPFPVAGLGASAGGVEAYVELLEALPADTRMAFVIVPHLSAEHESHLPEILSRSTKMPVAEIQHGRRLEPSHVYVLPAGKRVTIAGGKFQLEPRPQDGRLPTTIDRFFRSLAHDQKNRAIGVLLSGSDSDGALGLKAIKGEGGIGIVQDPESAQFSSMPRSGLLTEHIDLVLRPSEIAAELARLASEYFHPDLRPLEEGALPASEEAHFARILTLLRTVTGIDFRLYKQATLRRRIARRMMIRRIHSLRDFSAYLEAHSDELAGLHEDVLINVTRFFRDPEAFDALKAHVFPRMFENRPPEQQVRIWVAGCSTGEEAYSIAICLLEFVAGHAIEPPLQIFGTDASGRSIEKARAGFYPETIAAEVSQERLRRFFIKTDNGYQVSKRIRDLCIFARQNLCNDPLFSRLDLVSCRNVLIYLGAEIQQRIMTTFHYALRPNGQLLLGSAESIREHVELFTPIDRKHKFYVKASNVGYVIPPAIPGLTGADLQTFGPPARAREARASPMCRKPRTGSCSRVTGPQALSLTIGWKCSTYAGTLRPTWRCLPALRVCTCSA